MWSANTIQFNVFEFKFRGKETSKGRAISAPTVHFPSITLARLSSERIIANYDQSMVCILQQQLSGLDACTWG